MSKKNKNKKTANKYFIVRHKFMKTLKIQKAKEFKKGGLFEKISEAANKGFATARIKQIIKKQNNGSTGNSSK